MAFFPPHVHPSAWAIAVAAAALMGFLAAPRFEPGPARVWLAALTAIALAINLLTAYQPLQAARTLAMWGAYLCVFLYCAGLQPAAAPSHRAARAVLGAVVVAGTALAIHGLHQTFYAFEQMARAAREQGLSEALLARIQSGRAVATLGLPDALSGLLALALPISFAMARGSGGGRLVRIAFCGCALAQAAGLLATRSAGGLAALALGVAAALGWRGRTRKGALGRGLAIALVAVGLAGAGLLLVVRLGGPGSQGEGNPLVLREGNWRVALSIAADHPLFGAGAGCYGIAFPAHRAWGMNETQFVHNSYLQIVSEIGAPLGCLALAGAAWFAFRLLSGRAAAFLAASCLTFLVHNTADFTFYVPSVALTFFCLAGLAAGDSSAPISEAMRRGALSRVLAGAGAVALAVFALALARADLKREAARAAAREGSTALAERLAEQAVSSNPFDPESRSLLSHLMLDRASDAGDPSLLDDAERHARRAIELDPRTPHHWNHLGRLLLARGDRQGSYVALARAAQLYPIKIEYRQDRDAVGAALSGTGPAAQPPGAPP